MLIFTRNEGQSFFVGEAKITIFRAGRGQVKLGIDAPTNIPVDREEIREKKLKESSHD